MQEKLDNDENPDVVQEQTPLVITYDKSCKNQNRQCARNFSMKKPEVQNASNPELDTHLETTSVDVSHEMERCPSPLNDGL